MKIQIASDLHIDINKIKSYEKILKVCAPNLAICGDITNNVQGQAYKDFLKYCQKNYKNIFIITGNHEYYGTSKRRTTIEDTNIYISNLFDQLNKSKSESDGTLYFLNNSKIIIDGVCLIGTTLWSDIQDDKANDITNSLYDYKYISYIEQSIRKLNTNKVKEMFKENVKFIVSSLEHNLTNVILTHHAPIMEASTLYYPNSNRESAFASDLKNLYSIDRVKFWIFGHTHYKYDKTIDGCRIISNPLGYNSFEKKRYNSDEMVDIDIDNIVVDVLDIDIDDLIKEYYE